MPDSSAQALEESEVLGLLTSLVDKSLVLFDDSTGRYRLLETVRSYAANIIANAGEAPDTRCSHLSYFLALVELGGPQLMGSDQETWLVRLEIEHDNIRAAMDWSVTDPDSGKFGLRMVGSLWQFWEVHGYLGEGRLHLEKALENPGSMRGSRERAMALNGAGVLACRQGDYASALAFHDESLAIRRELGDRRGEAGTLNNMGNAAYFWGRHPEAKELFERALEINLDLDNLAWQATNLSGLGSVACDQGDYDVAWELHDRSLRISRDLGNRWGIAASLGNLGNVAYDRGDYAEARPLRAQSLAIFNELGDRGSVANELEAIAAAAGGQKLGKYAARLWGASEALRDEICAPLPSNDHEKYDRCVAATREFVDEKEFAKAWAEGREMTIEQAIEYALQDSDDA